MYCNDCRKRWAKKLKEVWEGCEHCDFFWFCAECKDNHVDDMEKREDNHEIEDDGDGDEEVDLVYYPLSSNVFSNRFERDSSQMSPCQFCQWMT